MPDKKIDLSGFDEAVAVQPTKTIDLSGFDEAVKKKDSVGSGVSESVASPSVATEDKEPLTYMQQQLRDKGLIVDNVQQKEITYKPKLDFYKASNDVIPSYSDQVKDLTNNEAIHLEDSHAKLVKAEQKAQEISSLTGWPVDDVKEVTKFDELVKSLNPRKEAPQQSYLAAPIRGLYESVGTSLENIGGAIDKFSESLGFNPPSNGIISETGKWYKNAAKSLKATPDNAMGDLAQNFGAIVPAIVGSEIAMPSIALEGLTVMGVTVAKQVPKFPLFLGVEKSLKAYNESNNPLAPVTEFGKGFTEGVKYNMLGVPARAIGNLVERAAINPVLGEASAAIASGLFFGTDAAAEEYANTGNLKSRTFLSNFGLGAGFHVGQIKTKILEGMQQKATTNFFNATPNQIKESIEAPASKEDLRKQAIDFRQKAFKTDGQERNQYLIAASLADKTADIKAISDDVSLDKEKYIEGIKKDQSLTAERKTEAIDLVDRVHEYQKSKQEEFDLAQKEAASKAEADRKLAEQELSDKKQAELEISESPESKNKINDKFKADVEKLDTQKIADIDNSISEAQKRLNLPTVPETRISADTDITLSKIESGEPVTNEFVKSASDDLYRNYKDLETMKSSDIRKFTIGQIESRQEELGKQISQLEDHVSKQKEEGSFVGEKQPSEQIQEPIIAEDIKPTEIKPTKAILKPVEPLFPEEATIVPPESKVAGIEQKQPIVGEQQIDSSQLNLKENGKESSQKASPEKGRKDVLRKEERKARIEQIDAELGDVWASLADIVGAKKNLTGEQRAKLMPVATQMAKLYSEKMMLKGADLVDAIVEHFRSKGIEPDDELIKQITDENASEIRKGNKENPIPQEGVAEGAQGQIPVRDVSKNKEATRSEGEVKQRGFQTGSMEKRGGVFAEIAKEHPLYYNEKSENQQLKDAADWLDGKDEATIISSVTATKKVGTIEQRVNRKILVSMYLQDKINKFVSEGKLEEADATHENLIKVTDSLAKEGTEIAQGLQAYAKFQRLTPDAVAWTVNNEIRKQNQSKFPETDIKAIESSEKEIDKMSTDISHDAVESEKLTKVIETIADKNKGLKQEKTNSEKAKEIADRLRRIKSSNWGITLAADPISSIGIGVLDGAVELTAKSIEVTGNIADSISKGIRKIKTSDWYKSLTADQKRKIERLFEVNVKKDIGVDSLSKGQLAKYLKTEIKDLKVSIKDVINKHWTDPNTMGITLSERIVSDLGLSKAEADLVEKTMSEIIRDMLDGKVVDYISGEALPKSKAQKSLFLDKMRDFLMVGKMDEKIYRDIFAQKFGLTPDITKEEVTLITNLNKAVQATKNMGVFGDIVANEFAREIDKLIPKTRLQELFGGMIGLDYANALFGYTSHYVNIKSVFFNLLARPIMDVTRLEDWIDAARRGEISQLPIANAFNAWVDFAKAMGHGTTDFADIIKSGDLRAMHKYISDVKSIANLNVPELERHVYAKNRFKKVEFKGIDINAANQAKFVGRALAAEDALNYRGFEAVELASELRRKMQKDGFTNEQIKEQINRQVYGLNLTEAESKEVELQLAKEKENMASFGFKTDRFKDNRRRLEIVRDKLLNFEESELTDLREVAKGNVFNDTRGGIVNSVMASMSRFANKNVFTKLATMPHFMFFRIAGNIGDFSIDTIPAYGSARARGWTPTTWNATYMKHRADGMSIEKASFNAIFGKRLSVSELPWKTSQLGDKGSYRYKQQHDRARFGNLMFLTQMAVVMGLYAIGGDDKDESGESWFDISGGRFFDKDVYGREAKLMPPYTIKMGSWKWRYGNAPIMTFGFSVLGNYADMVKAGLPDEEISMRLKMMSRSLWYSIGALTDQQLMQGFKSMFQSGMDLVKNAGAIKANDESGESKPIKTVTNGFMKYIVKEQLSPFTAWLPTKNNLFQQSIQAYTGTAVESKDIPAMLAYDIGIHHFTNNKALDVLGNEVKRKPGYTGIFYEPAMIKDNPKVWEMTRWLQENDAYPANYYNRDEKYVYATPKSKGWLSDVFNEKKPSYESKTPSEDEFWQMRKLTGEMISKDLEKYKEAEYNGKKIWEIESKDKRSNGKTAMQDKVSKYVSEAKQQTRLYLFTWKELGQSDPKLFKTLYENKALPPYETKVSVYRRDQGGSIYRDENGEFVVKDKRDLMDESLSAFNADAFKEYFKLMKGVKTTNPSELNILSDMMWKTAVQTKAAMYTGE